MLEFYLLLILWIS